MCATLVMAAKSVVESRDVDGIPVIEVNGELDLFNINGFEVALQRAAERDVGAVIVSLAQARYFDSAAIHKLLVFRQQLSINRQALLTIKPSLESAQRILCISGLAGKKEVCESLDDAVKVATQLVAERAPRQD